MAQSAASASYTDHLYIIYGIIYGVLNVSFRVLQTSWNLINPDQGIQIQKRNHYTCRKCGQRLKLQLFFYLYTRISISKFALVFIHHYLIYTLISIGLLLLPKQRNTKISKL